MIHRLQPFLPGRDDDYRRWRSVRLACRPRSVDELRVEIADPHAVTDDEYDEVMDRILRANMAVYSLGSGTPAGKEEVRALGRRFGLERLDMNLRADEDSITSLRVVPGMEGTHYIPYTNRPLNWHTDGYYNTLQEQVRGIVLHCVSPPARGGENALVDPEIIYISLRDRDPAYIKALMQPDAMTIPANIEHGREIRPAQGGPVFSVDPVTQALHMRYTARTRSIVWKNDPVLKEAVSYLEQLLASDDDRVYRTRLEAGQGIICNNVLHRREGFEDDDEAGRQRLLFRARYHDRISASSPNDFMRRMADALVE